MSTPDTKNIGIKLQAVGENLNTWGDPNLNNDFVVASNLSSRWNALTINVGATTTISETNYSTSNDTEVAVLKLVAGTIAAAFELVIPSRAKRLLVWNATGYACTIKLSATTGFAIPTGRIVWAATDGSTDVFNMTANYGGLATPTSGSSDIPAWSAVETAIANATLPASAGTVLVSGTDTTAGYVGTKVTVAGTAPVVVTPTTTNPGANEIKVWTVSVGYLALTLQAEKTAGFNASAGKIYPVNIAVSGTVTFPASASQGDTIGIDNYGAGVVSFSWNGLKYYGATTTQGTASKGTGVFRYTNAATGWIDV